MASTYALPASAMTHSHNHGHTHLHTHSHSPTPGRQFPANSPRPLKPEISNGSMHSYSYSDFDVPRSHSRGRGHEREGSPLKSFYLPTPPDSTVLPPIAALENRIHEPTASVSQQNPYQSPLYPTNGLAPPPNLQAGIHSHPAFLAQPRSRFTRFLLPRIERWPLIHAILSDKDSRRIFYFMSLNFAFMMVQAFYGYLTDSLGLLSDSIHMFFDCLALGVGLFAAVASKWPPSERFPYGFGKIESLSGFGNGVFLMLISIEIMIEAAERLAEGRETKRLTELFIVSGLGLAVNLVGMACFGHHGHAGHDHGSHDHGHTHSHAHDEKHLHEGHHHDHSDHCEHNHDHDHNHQSPLLSDSPTKPKAHDHAGHSHDHDNENMHGIFLHVLADTMGSAAVMVSTLLIHFVGWNGWDPLASCIIAILIFLSSIPLIKSSAKKLLLTIPDPVEYNLRDTLAGVSDIRGVATYTVPRFWLGDSNAEEEEHILGVMHIVATRGSDLDDVRRRTREFLKKNGIEVTVQVEKDGDTTCWCGGAAGSRTQSADSHGSLY